MLSKSISREQLLNLIENAEKRVRVLGAVSFNLPFERYRDNWHERINAGTLYVEIICESEEMLSHSALIAADKQVSGQERGYDIGTFINIKNEPVKRLREHLIRKGCRHLEPMEDAFKTHCKSLPEEDSSTIKKLRANNELDMSPFIQCLSIKTSYQYIHVPTINIDDDYYITLSLTKFCDADKFELIHDKHIWYEEYKRYFHAYFDNSLGAPKYSTEITLADNRTEVILMYNDKRQVLGQMPRDSFLGSTRVKSVIWGMLFTRDGRVLIHQRSKNAKDNQGMWDKSIGGHVDINDIDTVKAAAREMLEELYKVEEAAQGQHSRIDNFNVNEDLPNFLGEWKADRRDTLPFGEIKIRPEETYFFRMDYKWSRKVINSPRILTDGKIQPVKVFADLYVFIMPESFNNNTNDLKNSKYALLELYELKDKYLDATKGLSVIINEKETDFKVTPDLENIINSGELWEEQLTSFVDYLKANL